MPTWIEKLYWSAFTAWHGREERRFPYLPIESVLRRQNRRIRAIASHAYRNVPFYRQYMQKTGLVPGNFRTARDLEKLPLVSGRQVSENPEQFCSSAVDRRRALMLDTTGSTGHYKRIYHDKHALFLARAGGQRIRHVISSFVGRSLGYREVSIFRGGGTGPVVVAFYDEHSWAPRGVRIDRQWSSPEDSFETNIGVINRSRPDVLLGFGSYLGAVFRHAWLKEIPIHRPKVVQYGGDALQEPDRRIIEEGFKIPILSSYQSCEALNIAFQCEQRAGFHVSLDQVTLRTVDANGATLPPGQTGEIVISNLINRATVLLNYRTGDLGMISASSCRCGRTLPMIERLDGRTEDVIYTPDGEAAHESVILSKLYAVPGVLQVQVIQSSLSRFIIRVVSAAQADRYSFQEQLGKAFSSALGTAAQKIELSVEPVGRIEPGKGGKFRSIVSMTSHNR